MFLLNLFSVISCQAIRTLTRCNGRFYSTGNDENACLSRFI